MAEPERERKLSVLMVVQRLRRGRMAVRVEAGWVADWRVWDSIED